MEPQIRYVRSADGTSIATASVGAGPELLWMITNGQMGVEGHFALPGFRTVLELIAERFHLVVFDVRGVGWSDRDVADLSLEARVADLKAVQESLGDGVSYLIASASSCPAAIAFAARHPDRVRRLLLWNGLANGRDMTVSRRRRILAPLIDVDWELYCKTVALSDHDWTEHGRIVATNSARALNADMFRRQWAAFRGEDASAFTSQIRCPTLVVHAGERAETETGVPFAVSRRLAAVIPGARLRTGDNLSPLLSMMDGSDARVILDFFGEEDPAPNDGGQLPSGTAIILFADIVDSTALTERLGDAAFRAKARALDTAMRAIIREAGGTTIDAKTLGDGVLATFLAASQAIDAALRCGAAGETQGLPLHLGLHAGDVIREANNVFGGAVNIASRISALSGPGEVLVSDTVRSLARTSAGVTFEDRGEHALKGVAEPQRVYAVRQDGA
jgi:class 3 adenylate cyclase